MRLMATADDFTGPVNIGSEYEMSMVELAEIIIELTGSSSKVVYQSLPSDDPLQRRPDISLASSVLGWTPSTNPREGLSRTVAYFQERLG